MNARGQGSGGGLTALDALKILAGIVVILVLIRVVGAIVGAVMGLLWTLLVGVAVVAALWIAWSFFSGAGRDS